MKKIEVYEARGEKDQNEGRGGMYVIGHFLNEEDAVRAAAGKGVWGNPGRVEKSVLVVFETYKEYAMIESLL